MPASKLSYIGASEVSLARTVNDIDAIKIKFIIYYYYYPRVVIDELKEV